MRIIIMIVLLTFSSTQVLLAQNEDFKRIDVEGFAHQIELSPDGQLIVTFANSSLFDGNVTIPDVLDIRIYSADSGDLLHSFTEATDFTKVATFSPDNSLLATAHWNGLINLWDVNTGDLVKTLYGTRGTLAPLLFVQDGQVLISRTDDQISQYLFWDLSSFDIQSIMTYRFDSFGQFRNEILGSFSHISMLSDVASILSPDEKTMITASQTGAIWLWDIEKPSQNPTLLMEGGEIPGFPIRNLYFMPNGESLIFYFDRQKDVMESGLYQLTIATGELTLLTDAYEMASLTLSNDGNVIVWGDQKTSTISFASISDLDHIEIIDLTTEEYLTRTWGIFSGNFQFIDDDQTLIVSGFLDDEFATDFLYVIDVPSFDN